MANIQARRNKQGKIISYCIRVHKGRDPVTGKQLKPYTTTWTVPKGWSEKKAESEARKQAAIFEKNCKDGVLADGRQTFAAYAEYAISMKERNGLKKRTINLYRERIKRINDSIGHIKLKDIRPRHLNMLYEQLAKEGTRKKSVTAVAKIDLREFLKERGMTQRDIIKCGRNAVHYNTVHRACYGGAVEAKSARFIAKALKIAPTKIFTFYENNKPLSNRTIKNYHIVISTILAEAEKEMLIPYNPALKANPPKAGEHNPNYLQPEDITQIIEALKHEPIKWRTIIHLFLVTGCRRGEILGLKWSRVDFENNCIFIDRHLLYTAQDGIFEDTPKTKSSVRYISLPPETIQLLKEYKEWQNIQIKKMGNAWVNSGYVCTNKNGNAMCPDMVGTYLNRFSKKYGLKHLNPHAFRHTQASILFFNDVDPVSISKRLGHKLVSTTTDIYSHVIKQAEAKVTDCVASVIYNTGS